MGSPVAMASDKHILCEAKNDDLFREKTYLSDIFFGDASERSLKKFEIDFVRYLLEKDYEIGKFRMCRGYDDFGTPNALLLSYSARNEIGSLSGEKPAVFTEWEPSP